VATVLSKQPAPAALPRFKIKPPPYPGPLDRKARGSKVGDLQYVMAWRGYTIADAVFGDVANNGLEDWKKRFKIVEKGGDQKTWNSLWFESVPPGAHGDPPQWRGPVEYRRQGRKMTGVTVGLWYYALRYRNYPLGDAVFGADTEKKIKDWQTKHRLKVDGVLGPKTWHSLLNDP
jgi:peptidoglycan hydrolase-like protein with peptidoglycan-binding domain